jgi:hypothetical protein
LVVNLKCVKGNFGIIKSIHQKLESFLSNVIDVIDSNFYFGSLAINWFNSIKEHIIIIKIKIKKHIYRYENWMENFNKYVTNFSNNT